jgi:glucose-6-phosphate isomerase
MNSILEVIIIGHLIGVNPFGQPGVERLKTNVKTLL